MFLHLSVLLFTGGLCPEGSLSNGSLSLGGLQGVSVLGHLCPEGSLSRGLCPGGLCPGVSLSRGVSVQGVSVQRGHQRSLSWGSLSSTSLSMGVSVQGHLCPEGSLSRGSLSLGISRGSLSWGSLSRGGLCQGDHPAYGKERAVRILLECILVMQETCKNL